ncbi:MAG TPA: GNAT family N-acetyltransferase [Candidatus Paceibacterota bacterium]
MNVHLQRVSPADVDTYVALEKKRAGLKTYHALTDTNEALQQIKDSVNYFILSDTTIVGSISYKVRDVDTAEIDGVLILPDHEGMGYAKAALNLLLKELVPFESIFLMTHPMNPRSIHLYTSVGFTEAGRVENYFGDGEPRLKFVLNR